MNAIQKYVASRTLSAEEASSRWNNTDAPRRWRGDAIEAIRSLRASGGDGGLQVWGSTSLARQLVENDLVDEYQLMLEPILLGGGKTIFPSDGQARAAGARVGDAGEDGRAHLRLPPGPLSARKTRT